MEHLVAKRYRPTRVDTGGGHTEQFLSYVEITGDVRVHDGRVTMTVDATEDVKKMDVIEFTE